MNDPTSSITLYLLRHAKSSWEDEALTDFERPLNPRGKKSADKMGEWLNTQGVSPAKIVCSPARRAKDTCLRVAQQMEFSHKHIIWEHDMYEASRVTLSSVILKHAHFGSLMLVGHNPGFELLVKFLCGNSVANFDAAKFFPTAAFCSMTLPSPDCINKAGSATLNNLIRPREIF